MKGSPMTFATSRAREIHEELDQRAVSRVSDPVVGPRPIEENTAGLELITRAVKSQTACATDDVFHSKVIEMAAVDAIAQVAIFQSATGDGKPTLRRGFQIQEEIVTLRDLLGDEIRVGSRFG
jgi:hypothetical protein